MSPMRFVTLPSYVSYPLAQERRVLFEHPYSSTNRGFFYSSFFFGLMTFVRSKTGGLGSGSSIVSIIMPRKRYQPSISAAKNPAPVATRHVAAISAFPSAV
jgi:hypothetical protein